MIFKEVEELEMYILECKKDVDLRAQGNKPNWVKEIVIIQIGDMLLEFKILRAYLNLKIGAELYRRGLSLKIIRDNLMKDSGTSSNTIKYINKILDLFEDEQDKKDIGEFISNSFLRMGQILESVISYDISYFDLFEITEKDPLARKIIIEGGLVTPDMSPYQIMQVKQQVGKDLTEIVKKHKWQPFHTFLQSQSCMRFPQFVDCFGLIGGNPNEETVIPYLVETSWFRGIRNIDEFWVQASTARVAKILEKCKIAPTGTALKDSMFINKGLLVKDGDCGTKHLLQIYIADEIDLKAHDGMNYAFNEDVTEYKKVSKESKELIGKTIYVRSAATCAFIEDSLCSTCAGVKIRSKFDFGLDCAMQINGNAGQTVLSAKHINILVAMKHIDDKFTHYINNTIYNKLKISVDVKDIYFINKVENDNKIDSNLIELVLENGDVVRVSIMDTVVSVFKNNIDGFGKILNIDLIGIVNKNNPKSKLFNIIMGLIGVQQKGDVEYEKIVGELYSACRGEYHATQIYTFICKHLRNPNNIYERFDFRNRHIGMNDGVFMSVEQLLKLQPLNESLPHGKAIVENFISTPQTFNGVRASSSDMDVVLIPRNKSDIVRMIRSYDLENKMKGDDEDE